MLVLLLVYWLAGWRIAEPIIYGYAYSLFTITFGFISIYWAFAKSTNVFLAVILGGMFLRFILLGAVLFVVLRFTALHFISFLLSLIGFYFVLQLFEIRVIHRELVRGK